MALITAPPLVDVGVRQAGGQCFRCMLKAGVILSLIRINDQSSFLSAA